MKNIIMILLLLFTFSCGPITMGGLWWWLTPHSVSSDAIYLNPPSQETPWEEVEDPDIWIPSE